MREWGLGDRFCRSRYGQDLPTVWFLFKRKLCGEKDNELGMDC